MLCCFFSSSDDDDPSNSTLVSGGSVLWPLQGNIYFREAKKGGTKYPSKPSSVSSTSHYIITYELLQLYTLVHFNFNIII
jgi:hypothetical protein